VNGPARATLDPHAVPLTSRTALALTLACAAGLLAFAWPLVLSPGSGLEHGTDAPLVLAGVLLAVIAVVLVSLSEGGIDVKAIAVLGLLTAVGSVLRPLSAGTAGVELVFVVIVLGGRVFGPGFGFALGSTTIFASALLTGGAGPWMPFQMLAASWIGLGAGVLPHRRRGRTEVALLATYGAVAAVVFGLMMNLSFWPFTLGVGTDLSFVPGDDDLANLRRFGLYSLATSLGWDVGRAITTGIGIALLGRPVLAALRRTAARAAFGPAPVDNSVHSPGARTGAAPVVDRGCPAPVARVRTRSGRVRPGRDTPVGQIDLRRLGQFLAIAAAPWPAPSRTGPRRRATPVRHGRPTCRTHYI
jgi:energy-coupling factor transport system substrate-specific component